MRISLRILLINFIIVALILSASVFAFYSVLYNVLISQQSRQLVSATNNFIYALRSKTIEFEDEFLEFSSFEIETILKTNNLKSTNIDFILQLDSSSGNIIKMAVNKNVYLPDRAITWEEFLNYNPYALVQEVKRDNGESFYFGRVITSALLSELSQKINSEVAIVWNGTPSDLSNPAQNQKFLYLLTKANDYLKDKNNFEIYSDGTESTDIIAAVFKPTLSFNNQSNLYFLIFTSFGETGELRTTLRNIFIIVGIVGIALSLIFTFLFTDKLRKQISELGKATEQTYSGNFKHRIHIKSKDEIGRLGDAFNKMLDELDKKEKAKNEYSEFITLINQNPTLREISDAALIKIINIGGFIIGGLHTVDGDDINLISSYGFDLRAGKQPEKFDLHKRVLKTRERLELFSDDYIPVVSSGLMEIKIKHLLLLPIIYNNKITAMLELGSINKPSEEVIDYLDKIKDQLAIGITNSKALVQMENFVAELKKLNEEYQKQNIQIKHQNDTLIKLHNDLKEQAEELERQKEKAEESTRIKSQFLASMSHELRTPMNSILGLTELILEKANLEDKNRERLGVVLNSGKRLMNLINDILDLSKIEAGKMEIRYEDVILDEVIEEVSASITPLVNKKGIGFQVTRNIDTRMLFNTDRGKVTQVLINLLGNAVKFTDEGSVALRISADDDLLNFEVIDTGIGISEDDKKLIFEEFRQADGSTTRKYSGTGLGLAISKKISDLLGGSISVSSQVNQGSTFTFSIPMRFVDTKVPELQSKIDIHTLIKNRKNPILVIDDDEEVRYTIGQYLLSKGYDVIFAEDGNKGIQMAIENQPFAITLDVMLPGKDGWSILKELKDEPQTKDIPVIMVSIVGDKNLGYELGAFEYFIKPISSEKLLSAFSKLENLANKPIQKIVVVDDDELEFEKFKEEFSSDNIRIEYIRESEYAFSKIAEVQPDLIVIDIMMPKIDGITLSYKLKSNIKTRHIPIIISSAKDITGDEKTSLNNIVENIAVKSKEHPLNIFKVVRNRIEMQQTDLANSQQKMINMTPVVNGKIKNGNNDLAEKQFSADVLIVDDDSDTLYTLDEIVQACNCNTVLAKSGKECLSILEQKTFDLILLDIMMPEMDGFQTIKQIKLNKKWSDIPVFAVTAKAMKDDKDIVLKQGFSDYIPKPVNPTIMSFKIQKLISQLKTS
ncbi:MAG TPA: response regulator [Ignavibacteriaceae bacterium]|nr:response regulator [Ignavibacteriaceae bacterium]